MFSIYAICWILSFLGMLGQAITYPFTYREYPTISGKLTYERLQLSYYIFYFVTVVGSLSLNLAILLTYLKFSSRLERSFTQRIKTQLG